MAASDYYKTAFYDSEGNSKDFNDVLTEVENITDEDLRDSIKRQLYEQYYQQGPDIGTFETMLNKLTGAKMKQQGQIASQRRGDIYAGGLANMMSNF